MNKALLSSKNMNWCTPQDFFDQLNAEFDFELEQSATAISAKCSRYFSPETAALNQSWNYGGAVFCDPPYGRSLKKWIQKAYTESQSGQTIVLLIPARTDTAAFHDYIYGKAEIQFIRGRLMFTDEDGNPPIDAKGRPMPAPFTSMIVVYNQKEDAN